MDVRYTTAAAIAALVLSLVAVALSALAMSRTDDRAYSHPKGEERKRGEVFCINGFAYELRPSDPDSGGGRQMLQVMTGPIGEPSFDENGRKYPQQQGPIDCAR